MTMNTQLQDILSDYNSGFASAKKTTKRLRRVLAVIAETNESQKHLVSDYAYAQWRDTETRLKTLISSGDFATTVEILSSVRNVPIEELLEHKRAEKKRAKEMKKAAKKQAKKIDLAQLLEQTGFEARYTAVGTFSAKDPNALNLALEDIEHLITTKHPDVTLDKS